MENYSFRYKDLDLTNALNKDNKIYLQSFEYYAGQRLQITQNSNAHGSRISKALSNGRIYSFGVGILEEDRYKRGQQIKILQDNVKIEYNTTKNQYSELYFKNDMGDDRVANVCVYEEPRVQNDLLSPLATAQFSLYSPTGLIYDPFVKTASGTKGILGGVAYPYTLPDPRGGYGGGIQLYNAGDWIAPVKIQIVGECENPKIYNLTDSTYRYTIKGTTQNLVIDNTEDVFLKTNGGLTQTVKDQGIDFSSKRDTGKSIYLVPGVNDIVFTCSSGDPIINFYYRDTYKPG